MKHEIVISDKFGCYDMMEMVKEDSKETSLFEQVVSGAGDDAQRILALVSGLPITDKKTYMESETHQYLISECLNKRIDIPILLGILESEINNDTEYSISDIHQLVESQAKFLENTRARMTSDIYIGNIKDIIINDKEPKGLIGEIFTEYVNCGVGIPSELMEFVKTNSNESDSKYITENFQKYVK